MLSIRNASVADIPLIRELTFAVWPQTYSNIISKEQINFMLEMMFSQASLQKQMTEEGCTFIIVYDDDTAVAFAAYHKTKPQIFKLDKIYIVSAQQGKGTGKFIINYIIGEIKKHDARAIQLQVNRHNNAKLFYEKIGFRIIDTADFDIGNGYFMNDYVMELPL